MTKTCTKCKKEKSLEEFHKSSKHPLGRKPRCKACVKEEYDKYNSKEEIKERKRLWQQEKQHSTEYLENKKNYNREYNRSEEVKRKASERRQTAEYKEYMKEYRKKYTKTEKYKESVRKYSLSEKGKESRRKNSNSEKAKERNRVNAEKYKELGLRNQVQRRYRQNHPDKINALTTKRKAQKLKATPIWFEKEVELITFMYTIAKELSYKTGIKFHVDHIVPLKSKLVCGLHTIANLGILPDKVNLAKGNRFWPDMP
jgi:hypothetical protein